MIYFWTHLINNQRHLKNFKPNSNWKLRIWKNKYFNYFGIKEKCKFFISLLLGKEIGSGFSSQGFLIGRISPPKKAKRGSTKFKIIPKLLIFT